MLRADAAQMKLSTATQIAPALLAVLCIASAGCSDSSGPSTTPPPNDNGIITTIVGVPGTSGFNGDALALTAAHLNAPQDAELGPAGELVVIDALNHRVRSCNLTSNSIQTSVGSGTAGNATAGPALQCDINDPTGVGWDLSGRLVIAAQNNHRVLRLNTDGNVETIAGSGTAGFAGDGGPAVGGQPQAQLDHPTSAAYDNLGILYIVDTGNDRIRCVDPLGIITTYAGIGGEGYGGDGGSAQSAQLNFPAGRTPKISITFPETEAAAPTNAAGGKPSAPPRAAPAHAYARLVIADAGNHRVRLINLSTGEISPIAGNGTAAYAGDGGAAISASLNLPSDAVIGPDDSIYIADTANNVVRRVSPLGTIDTVAGTGSAGFAGDGGLATAAQLNAPAGIYVDANNVLYIADTGNHVVRRVKVVS
jgi:sugar lactone lactonase YvrE